MQAEISLADLLDNLVTHFTGDPLALVMALFGALFVVAASAVFGYLSLGAALDLIMPDVSNQSPPRAGK